MRAMKKNPNFDFSHLSTAERIRLAQDLWESVEPEQRSVPLTQAQRAFLDRRLAELEHDEGEPWETFRQELLADLDDDELENASAA
jgi:putative addiction module component (TIGR02574 family)